MARAGQQIESRLSGERATFLRTAADTGGELLEIESVWPPGRRAGAHLHPAMEERWELLSGAAIVRLGDEEHVLAPGDSVTAAQGTPHLAWNPGPSVARVRLTMRPALGWEDFMIALFALDPDDRDGLRRLLGASSDLVRPAHLPDQSR